MRRFLIGLAVYAALLSFAGAALEIDKAEAGKMVWVKCAKKSRAIPYPHFNGTRHPCGAPGFLVRVPYKFALRIRTYPILLAARTNTACAGGEPRVVTQSGPQGTTSSWRLVGQRCVKQRIAGA